MKMSNGRRNGKMGDEMSRLLSKTEVQARYYKPGWQRIVFAEFESTLTSKSRPFPCVFGVTGFKTDQLRFAFLDQFDALSIAPVLGEYLASARNLGRMTSLVLFARPGPVRSIDAYRQQFWKLLDELEGLDEAPRPEGVSEQMDTESWEFCFAGEPTFVVCNSPAHVLRQSRRSTSFMLTFQPRWVFDGITDSDDSAMLRALRTIRERLSNFDAVTPAPFLGKYGEPENREYQQYFIDDSNTAPACPFHALGAMHDDDKSKKGKVA